MFARPKRICTPHPLASGCRSPIWSRNFPSTPTWDQVPAQYRAAVILACQNVADTLRALQSDADALKASAEAEHAAKATYDLAQRQQGLGTISVIAVLNAEQAYRQAELSLVQAQANRYADTAGLFQSLGGGWWNRTQEP